jgi:2-polyprenyl-3-methyl-5-hydroxy-6-metoxy-1,4-benzoquinol methylase
MLTYDVSPFEVSNIARAQAIILTPTAEGRNTEERWQIETEYLLDLIGHCCKLGPGSTVLDYGCGVGRLSKPIIERYGARVTGVDASAHMLALARDYVRSDRFCTLTLPGLDYLIREDSASFDAVISVWTLQHAKYPAEDIYRIQQAMIQDGRLFVVNEKLRCVPTRELGWIDDGIDIRRALKDAFGCVVENGLLMPDKVGEGLSQSAFWAVYNRREE